MTVIALAVTWLIYKEALREIGDAISNKTLRRILAGLMTLATLILFNGIVIAWQFMGTLSHG